MKDISSSGGSTGHYAGAILNLYYTVISIFFWVQFVIHEAPGQELEVEIYDEDTDKDDFMGR